MLRAVVTTVLLFGCLLVQLTVMRQTVSANVLQAVRAQERQLQRGGKVSISNPFGPTVIEGSDRDVVQVAATIKGNSASVTIEDLPGGRLLVRPSGNGAGTEVTLNVSLPRYAIIESISSAQGDVEIMGLEGPVEVTSQSGDVKISKVSSLAKVSTESGKIEVDHVGSVQAKSQSGALILSDVSGAATVETNSGRLEARNIAGDFIIRDEDGSVTLENISGDIDAVLSGGSLKINNAGSNIKGVTINGSVEVQCVQGNVEANTVTGSVTLSAIGGANVSAKTTSGRITLITVMNERGRYTLRSLEGSVRMAIESEAPGFNAALSSHSGGIETDFPLAVGTTPVAPTQGNRRVVGRYRTGRAQIELDSFEGSVSLNKAASGSKQNCPK